MKVEIKLLTTCREHIPSLAKLWYEEISKHWSPDASIQKAEQKLLDHLNSDKLPMAFVALLDDQPVGMVCLRETDGIRPTYTPWLGSLVVQPAQRGKQIGEALIETVKAQAKLLGYPVLYLLAFDFTIPRWYAKLGWESVGEDTLFGHKVTVMSVAL